MGIVVFGAIGQSNLDPISSLPSITNIAYLAICHCMNWRAAGSIDIKARMELLLTTLGTALTEFPNMRIALACSNIAWYTLLRSWINARLARYRINMLLLIRCISCPWCRPMRGISVYSLHDILKILARVA